jgi:hypothetical protein
MLLWIAAIVLLVVFASWRYNAFGITKRDLRRVNDEGPVEITIVYLNPLEKQTDSEISFEVRMNTHSVDLDAYEMEKICILQIDGGPDQRALGWFEPGGGGHHVSGVLKYTGPVPSDAKFLQVIIRDVGGVPERVFEWKLPLD